MSMYRLCLLFLGLMATLVLPSCRGGTAEVKVSDLASLIREAAGDGRTIRMTPGTYRLSDIENDQSIEARRKAKDFVLMAITGNRNELILEGVVIEWDTRFRQALRSPVHTNDIEIRGSGNRIRGLEIRCLGDGTSPGGALVSIQGKDNLLEDCRFHVRGSSPYGYGDVFGKGSPTIISHRKQNGVQVAGNGTVLRRCHLKMESFGHGIYIQKNAQDILIEDCLVEGEVRKTEEMLAETSGPAFDKGFRTTFRNHEGKETLLKGYMKSLAEDGFRTYDDNRNVVIRNCVARNMRGGFELRTKSGAVAENCRAEGCERGFWVGDHSVVKGCFADVIHGPALYVEGRGVRADIEVDLTESDRIVHQLASLHGEGHEVVIRGGEGVATRDLPIRIGFSTPPAGENMAPAVERPARRMKLINETPMPVLVGAQSQGVVVKSRGPVVDRGKDTVKEEMGE